MGPAVYEIADWVMERGEEFVTADLRKDPRMPRRGDGDGPGASR